MLLDLPPCTARHAPVRRETNLAVWYAHIDVEASMKEFQAGVGQAAASGPRPVAKARTRDSLQAFDKFTHVVDGQPRSSAIRRWSSRSTSCSRGWSETRSSTGAGGDPQLPPELPSDRRHLLEEFRLADVARKVVGVGSVGTRAWIVLMLGRDDMDPLFLQAKEAEASVLEEFVGRREHRSTANGSCTAST